MKNKEQKSAALLREIVKWWDEWNASANPTEMEDPPIEEARELLKELSKKN